MRDSKLKVIKGGRVRRNRLWLRLFALGIVVLVAFLVWNSMGHLALLAAKVTVARHSTVITGVPVSCVVLRNQAVVSAPAGGKYIPLVADGTRVKVGQVFARIEGKDGVYDLSAPVSGLIQHGGGQEEALVLDVLDAETAAAAASFIKDPSDKGLDSSVDKNQAVAAVVDNVRFQLVTGMDFYTEGRKQTLVSRLEDGRELSFIITPREALEHDNRFWVLWDAPALPDVLGMQTVFSGEMVTAEQELVLIPEGALYSKDGERGVFILFRSRPIFSPVEVLYSEDGMLGVTGLTNGQRVLSLPKWFSFAKRWWE